MTSYAELTLAGSLSYLADCQGAISNNIANATTLGYKRRLPVAEQREGVFQSMLDESLPSVFYNERTDFGRGSARPTFDRMTVALGEGQFFRVQDARGTFYTRRGEFVLDPEGNLATASGARYLGADGQPITLGNASEMRIAEDGRIDATVDGQDTPIGQLGVWRPAQQGALRPAGGGLYTDPSGATAQPEPAPSVQQGYVEESNVDVLEQLTQMISVQRSFQASSHALSSIDRIHESYVQAMNR